MQEVIKNPPHHVPLWVAATQGKPDRETAYAGYNSAVDWPTAAFWRETAAVYPKARVILTIRSAESWAESFSETILALVSSRDKTRPRMLPFLDMVLGVIARTGFGGKSGAAELVTAFNDHTAAVRAAISADRLLAMEVKEGWEPLCKFLGQPVPDGDFPLSNGRAEFWDRIKNAA